MAKRKGQGNNFLGTLLMLLLIIPITYGIYFGSKFIIGDGTDINTSQGTDLKQVDVYVAGAKIMGNEHTHLISEIGKSVNIEFKEKGQSDYLNSKITYMPNQAAIEALEIKDTFGSDEFTNTKITLLQITNNAKVIFMDAADTFSFILNIKYEYTSAAEIIVPDITFYE